MLIVCSSFSFPSPNEILCSCVCLVFIFGVFRVNLCLECITCKACIGSLFRSNYSSFTKHQKQCKTSVFLFLLLRFHGLLFRPWNVQLPTYLLIMLLFFVIKITFCYIFVKAFFIQSRYIHT